MARISAGSTLTNQYAPPFVVADNVATGWELQWNADILAFEAYDPSGNVVETGFDSIDVALFEDVTQQVFVVPWETDTKQSLIITIQGVKQQQDAYTYTSDSASGTTTITLDDSVLVETVEILGLQTSGGASTEIRGPVPADSNTSGIAQSDFALGWLAPSVQSLIVTVDGVKQATNTYSIIPNATATDTTLRFLNPTATFLTDATGIDDGTEVITTNSLHGFATRDGITYSNEGGAAVIGLTNGTLYYVRALSTSTLSLHPTSDDAFNNTNPENLTANLSELHTLIRVEAPVMSVSAAVLEPAPVPIGYSVNEKLTINSGLGLGTQARFNVEKLSTILTQDETNFTGGANGTISNAGTGHNDGDAITLSDGTVVTVAAGNGAGPITLFDITTATTTGIISNNDVLTQVSSTGGGINFELTLGDANQGIFSFTILNAGAYSVFPVSPVTTSSDGVGVNATFTLTKDSQLVEVVGILTAGETPASPVSVISAYGLDDPIGEIFSTYKEKILSGDEQILSFKAIEAGANVTIADNTNRLTITSTQPTFGNIGAGTALADIPGATDDVEFRGMLGGDRIALSVASDTITVDYAIGYQAVLDGTDADPYVQLSTDRLIAFTVLTTPHGVTLLDPSTVPVGDTVTVKNQTADVSAITITPAAGQIQAASNGILGATHVLSGALAYVTFYSDGTNYYVIAEG